MEVKVAFAFDPEKEMPIRSKMGGHYTSVPRWLGILGTDYENKREAWLEFCRDVHNTASLVSADLHMKLTAEMDVAMAKLRPHLNRWSIAREGYSLN